MKHVPLILIVAGLALQVPVLIWALSRLQHLTRAEIQVALAPLAEIPLGELPPTETGTAHFNVPASEKSWQRIRRVWGDAPLALVVVSDGPSGRQAHDISDLGLTPRVMVDGRLASLRTTNYTPYGYSAPERFGSVEVNAASGSKIVVEVTRTRPVDIPGARLIAVFAWRLPVKDALVSAQLDENMAVIGAVFSLVGMTCLIVGLMSRRCLDRM